MNDDEALIVMTDFHMGKCVLHKTLLQRKVAENEIPRKSFEVFDSVWAYKGRKHRE